MAAAVSTLKLNLQQKTQLTFETSFPLCIGLNHAVLITFQSTFVGNVVRGGYSRSPGHTHRNWKYRGLSNWPLRIDIYNILVIIKTRTAQEEEEQKQEEWSMLKTGYTMRYDTIYDTVYLTCSKKLTDSQLSLPHGMNKNIKEKAVQ